MKIHNAVSILVIFFFGCGSREKYRPNEKSRVVIVNLPALSWVDTLKDASKARLTKVDYFLVKCERLDSIEIRVAIDRFSRNVQATNPNSYSQYNMLYFRETAETNEKNLAADKDMIDTYSTKHDLIYEYVWKYNKLMGVYQYENGLIINPKATIKIEDANQSGH